MEHEEEAPQWSEQQGEPEIEARSRHAATEPCARRGRVRAAEGAHQRCEGGFLTDENIESNSEEMKCCFSVFALIISEVYHQRLVLSPPTLQWRAKAIPPLFYARYKPGFGFRVACL